MEHNNINNNNEMKTYNISTLVCEKIDGTELEVKDFGKQLATIIYDTTHSEEEQKRAMWIYNTGEITETDIEMLTEYVNKHLLAFVKAAWRKKVAEFTKQ